MPSSWIIMYEKIISWRTHASSRRDEGKVTYALSLIFKKYNNNINIRIYAVGISM